MYLRISLLQVNINTESQEVDPEIISAGRSILEETLSRKILIAK